MRQKPYLSSVDVREIAEAARARATELGLAVTIAVTDDGGHLLYLERLDAKVHTVSVACGKARTAALMRLPSRWLEEQVKENTALLGLGFMPVQGGVPLMVGSDCVGAIGVSGARADLDESVADAGCARLAQAAG